jgi:4-amino-4-deoxy-L-arabinose transferase-like glycosyltransferase
MPFTIQSLENQWQRFSLWLGFPYLSLLTWILPLLIFNSGQQSLMAHDEGLYAGRARLMIDSGDWIHPWGEAHHKTPGPYWIIAIFYKLFGVSETSVRLPNMIFGSLCILLLYEIGKIILGKKIAWLGSAICAVEFLWLQYCRLGAPDIPMIFLVLLAILCLLKSESDSDLNPKYRYILGFIAGLCFGIGFLVRSFMIMLPAVALLPYVIRENYRHRHLFNPAIYVGFLIGLLPTFAWLILASQRYGQASVDQLLAFVFALGSDNRHNHGPLFYLWNVPIKSFPWFFFAIYGAILTFRRPLPKYKLLLVGFPLTLFIELSIFSTRLSHYGLLLYPFIGLLAAIALQNLGNKFGTDKGKKLTRNLSFICGALGIIFLFSGIGITIIGNPQIRKYVPLGIVVGFSLLILPIVWLGYYRFNNKSLTASHWIAGWLLPLWLGIAVSGGIGLIGDYNPDIKNFIQQPMIAEVLKTQTINFVQVGGKTEVLLKFYTPTQGTFVDSLNKLSPGSYAWISESVIPEVSEKYHIVGRMQKYLLIRLISN